MECERCSADGGVLVGVVSGKYCGDIMRMVLQAGVEDSTLHTGQYTSGLPVVGRGDKEGRASTGRGPEGEEGI